MHNYQNTLRTILSLFLLLLLAIPLKAQDLRSLAETKGVYFGNIMSSEFLENPSSYDGGLHDAIMGSQYNAIVLENDMKMSYVLPANEPANLLSLSPEVLAAQLNATGINAYIAYAEANNLRARGHAMIWFNQAPSWLNQSATSWTAQEVFDFSRTYIQALSILCGDAIDEWDVINEAIADNNDANGNRVWRTGTWYDNANDGSITTYGEASFDNYVKMLFVWAREAQPNARLYYNDYSIEFFENNSGSKNTFMRNRFAAIKAAGAPIDGIGFQSHWTLSDVAPDGVINSGLISGIESSMQWLASVDLDVAITELDVRICSRRATLDQQRVAYFNLIQSAFSQPNCREVLIWGMRDDVSWIETTNIFRRCNSATLYELPGFTPKPAWFGAEEALGTLPNASFPPVFPPLNPGVVDPTGGGVDEIIGVTAPSSVEAGTTVDIDVEYEAREDREITVVFQLDESPFTVYSATTLPVSSGAGILTITIEIPLETPVAVDDYQFQTFVAPIGGGFDDLLSNLSIVNVDVTANSGGGGDQLIPDGSYYIKKSTENLFLNVTSSEGNLVQVNGTGAGTAFQTVHLGNNEYEITSLAFSGQRLEVRNAGIRKGALVGVTTAGAADHRVWAASAVGNAIQFRPRHAPSLALDIYTRKANQVRVGIGQTTNLDQLFTLLPVTVGMAVPGSSFNQTRTTLKAFPSPSYGNLSLQGLVEGPGTVVITSASGQMLYRKEVTVAGTQAHLDVSKLASGLYIVTVWQEESKQTVRFIRH